MFSESEREHTSDNNSAPPNRMLFLQVSLHGNWLCKVFVTDYSYLSLIVNKVYLSAALVVIV